MLAAQADNQLNVLGLTFSRLVWFVNNIRIRLVSLWVAGMIGFILIAGTYSAAVGLKGLMELRATWHRFDATTANKMTLLSEMRQALGYGGLVHRFQHYLLTADSADLQSFQTALERLRAAVPAYRTAGVNPDEERALAAILTGAGAYDEALQRARRALQQGTAAAEVARQVAVDDRPVLAAIELLGSRLAAARRDEADRVEDSVGGLSATIVLVFSVNGALLVILGLFLIWFMRIRLVAPMYRMRDGMVELSHGRRDIAVGFLDKQDEIGDMARALQVFKENAERAEQMKSEHERHKQEAEAARRREMLRLADELEDKVTTVVRRVAEGADAIKGTAESMSSHIGGGANRSLGAVEASLNASMRVTSVAESAEGLAASMAEVLRAVNESAAAAGRAVAHANHSEEQVRSLAEAASRISEVVGLINDLADKTNLLALNATIEAARAGEAGKGFAVVATEVKSLANQTAHATNEIEAQVKAIQQATNETVTTIQGIGGTIRETSDMASRIADLVTNYGSSTREIAAEAKQVSDETGSVADNVVSIAHTSASSCGASIRVIWAAEDLYAPIRQLESEVNAFLAAIRQGG